MKKKRNMMMLLGLLAAMPACASSGEEILTMCLALLVVFVMIALVVAMYVLVAVMAKHRNRSVVLWLLLSFITTPMLIWVILWAVGKADKKEAEYID